MRNKKSSTSRILRQLAAGLIEQMAEDGAVSDVDQEALVTSLVRQWVTYDGCATLILGDEQVYLSLDKTPLGKPRVFGEPAMPGWMKQLTRDWKINPEDLPDVIEQLNRGQSAEVTNEDNLPLRLWVNPKERSRGVEPLVKQPLPEGVKRDYRKIADVQMEQHFGRELDDDEMNALAASVARQWQKHKGHACLFVGGQELVLTLTEEANGGCCVTTERRPTGIDGLLQSIGFPPPAVPDVLARINLGQEIEFRDREGADSVLWHDPAAQRICVRSNASPPPPAPRIGASPIMCPRCGAVLRPWQDADAHQNCPLCGSRISRSAQ